MSENFPRILGAALMATAIAYLFTDYAPLVGFGCFVALYMHEAADHGDRRRRRDDRPRYQQHRSRR